MKQKEKKIPAGLGLTSGGLDSILAAVILREQGVRVEWLALETPFFSADKARRAAERLEIPIMVSDITAEYLAMLKNPPCGYGKNMNPCLDCHGLMAKIAGRVMQERSFDFVFTGEVVGQRPMSQTRPSLRHVEKQSGIEGYLLRPLSAGLLPETIPEQEGLVDRRRLPGISGRSRKPQIALAEQYGITDYPAPAGGCLLTDKCFADRLRDLFNHQETYLNDDFSLLKHGRHFRLSPEARLVVGRNKTDNENLIRHKPSGPVACLKARDFAGPTCLLLGPANEAAVMLAAGICAGYGKTPDDQPVAVEVAEGRRKRTVQMLRIPPEKVRHLMI